MFRVNLSGNLRLILGLLQIPQIQMLQLRQAVADQRLLRLNQVPSRIQRLLKLNLRGSIAETGHFERFHRCFIVHRVRVRETIRVEADHCVVVALLCFSEVG